MGGRTFKKGEGALGRNGRYDYDRPRREVQRKPLPASAVSQVPKAQNDIPKRHVLGWCVLNSYSHILGWCILLSLREKGSHKDLFNQANMLTPY